MKKVVILLVVATLLVGGCSSMSPTQQRVLSGTRHRRQQRRPHRLGCRFAGGRRRHRCGSRGSGRVTRRPVREISRPELIPAAPRSPRRPEKTDPGSAASSPQGPHHRPREFITPYIGRRRAAKGTRRIAPMQVAPSGESAGVARAAEAGRQEDSLHRRPYQEGKPHEKSLDSAGSGGLSVGSLRRPE